MVLSLELSVTHIEPTPQHPRPVLFDLQPLDIDDRQNKADEHTDTDKSDPTLDVKASTKCHMCDHQRTDETHDVQQHSQVPRDAVNNDPFMADKRRELNANEHTRRQNAPKMDHDPDLVAREVVVIVAFSGRS